MCFKPPSEPQGAGEAWLFDSETSATLTAMHKERVIFAPCLVTYGGLTGQGPFIAPLVM